MYNIDFTITCLYLSSWSTNQISTNLPLPRPPDVYCPDTVGGAKVFSKYFDRDTLAESAEISKHCPKKYRNEVAH